MNCLGATSWPVYIQLNYLKLLHLNPHKLCTSQNKGRVKKNGGKCDLFRTGGGWIILNHTYTHQDSLEEYGRTGLQTLLPQEVVLRTVLIVELIISIIKNIDAEVYKM